ncbi:unnamed protein product, partial [Medioppia subpectinata]
ERVAVIRLENNTFPLGFQLKDIYKTEKDILDKVLDKSKYDLRIVPRYYNETSKSTFPAIVRTNMYIRGIEYISVDNMAYKIQMTFRQQWNDNRLAFNDTNGQIRYLVLDDSTRLWIPDTFFSNSWSTQSHTDIKPNVLFRIYPNGNVLFSKRITATLSCPMDLKYFPFDTQICSIQMVNGYTTADLVLLWKVGDPVQVTKNLIIKEFKLNKYSTAYCTSKTNTGEYSCLKVDLQFTRITVKYLVQWFVTTAMLTFISFLSFLMKASNSSRIKFLVVVLFMLYTHIVVINMWSDAKVPYFIAKDWWFMWCANFIVAAIIEFAIVKVIDHKCNKNSNNNNGHGRDNVALKTLETKECYDNCREKWTNSSFGRKLDLFCVVIFPMLFTAYIYSNSGTIQAISGNLWFTIEEEKKKESKTLDSQYNSEFSVYYIVQCIGISCI